MKPRHGLERGGGAQGLLQTATAGEGPEWNLKWKGEKPHPEGAENQYERLKTKIADTEVSVLEAAEVGEEKRHGPGRSCRKGSEGKVSAKTVQDAKPR